jgi:hypothetical protein
VGGIRSSGTTAIAVIEAVNNAGSLSLNARSDINMHLIDATVNPLGIRTIAAQPVIFSTNETEKARIDSSGRLLVGTSSKSATASTATGSKGIIGIGGGGSIICAEGQIANNGTIDITLSTNNLHYFTGLLQVNNIDHGNGAHRTQSLISVIGSSQLELFTTSILHTANGSQSRSFTITYVPTGIIRFTNTSGHLCNVQITYMGGGINAS